MRQGGLGAELLLDLDDSTTINDTMVHLVAAIASRLERVTRSSVSLFRLDDDEFNYLAEGLIEPVR